jgi:hypothetical protein
MMPVQRDDRETEHVLPEKRGRKEVLAEHDLFPDRAGDHDRQQDEGLHDYGDRGGIVARPSPHEAQHKPQRRKENQELQRREHTLYRGPDGCIASFAFLRGVKLP